ncbi:DUF4158 domain-containing protein [Mesorhizobium sp. M0895]|uniref:DUF4158 domain-containing protein n=1 Tax=Mesorhizobium sp. M0895 TaxID=2957019 RepID=UPI00333A62D4
MRKHELLTEEEREQLIGISSDRDGLARLYTFESPDLDLIRLRREDRNRLGAALCESAPKVDPVRNGGKCLTLLAKLATRVGSSSAPIVTPPDLHFISPNQGFTGPMIGVNLRC